MAESKRSNALLIVGCLGVAVAILAGTAGLAYWRQRKVAEEVGRDIEFQFRDHPHVVSLIGADAEFRLESMEMDDDKDQAVIVLVGHGSAGTGRLRARIEKGTGPGGVPGFNVIAADLACEGHPQELSLLPEK